MDWTSVVWETYVPAFDGNRERAARGEPHVTVAIRPPTAGVRRRYLSDLVRRARELSRDTGLPVEQVVVPFSDDTVDGPMFCACIGAIAGLTVDGQPVADGAALWALRGDLAEHGFYTELWTAIQDRDTLDAGTVRFLGLPGASAGPPSPGTAATAGPVTSIRRIGATA